MTDIIPPQGLPLNPTAQQVFDRVATHLLTQNQKAIMGPGGPCRYRTDTGLSCAVGCLIPNAVYSPSMEGDGLSHLVSQFPWMTEVGLHCHEDLLLRLQWVHDQLPEKDWWITLRGVARSRNLDQDVLNTLEPKAEETND